MREFGSFIIAASFFLSLYGMTVGIYSGVRSNLNLTLSARNALLLSALFSVFALFALGYSFVNHDYSNLYVWQHSNNAMRPGYLISAIWGGMDGSMLLWAGIMGVFSAAVLLTGRDSIPRAIYRWLVPILSGGLAFFLFVVTVLTNPFRVVALSVLPEDGNGLNPLLQNPSMLIHPPMLYLGFTGFFLPAAFCLATLCSGELSVSWTRLVRYWALLAWAFLTTGIILGGNWAYIELGWGGFWAWDPVENASFLPWLTGTAYLHSVMVQERRGMLKVWNVVLAVLTYMLTVYGTFLTRSGVVQSVHAFAESDVGSVFLVYLAVVVVLAVLLIVWRWKELRPENSFESFLSRDAIFLLNNLILLAICFATFWGVMFPIISEALVGKKSVVGPPFFDAVNVPLFLSLLLFMGIGPLLSWRKTSRSAAIRALFKPLMISAIIVVFCFWLDPSRPLAALAFGFSALVIVAVFSELHTGVLLRKKLTNESVVASIGNLVRRKSARYGGLFAHVGAAIMAVAITASSAYKQQSEFTLKPGESFLIGNYSLRLEKLTEKDNENYLALLAEIKVSDVRNGKVLGKLFPERRHYIRTEETTAEVALRMSAKEDLYLALAGLELEEAKSDVSATGAENTPGQSLDSAKAAFKVFVNPLQIWLWIGGGIMLVGTLLVMSPVFSRERRTVTSSASVLAKAN